MSIYQSDVPHICVLTAFKHFQVHHPHMILDTEKTSLNNTRKRKQTSKTIITLRNVLAKIQLAEHGYVTVNLLVREVMACSVGVKMQV
jgi:hypothetical protein